LWVNKLKGLENTQPVRAASFACSYGGKVVREQAEPIDDLLKMRQLGTERDQRQIDTQSSGDRRKSDGARPTG
jgi:hypothetical protein